MFLNKLKKNLSFILSAILIIIGFSAARATLASDQLKSTDHFVGTSATAVSSATDFPFALYIGDNLTGVTDPIKSAYFTITGVYTGGGSLQAQIDSSATTSKTFLLPSVSVPTSFELIYYDNSDKINPQSAGSYSYTLNLLPSGVTISGLGAKLETTYQFAQTACPDGQPADEKMKSTDHFVGTSATAVSSATDFPFALYIGDNLTGVTDPIKSAYFTITGVYTGGGSLQAQIDSSATTSKTFLLPSVSVPTSFELIYYDNSDKINPQSAGSYSYTLNLLPSGVTISGLGAKLETTYQYRPPSCGVSYPPYGDLISAIFDSTASSAGAAYNSILWRGVLGGASFDTGKVLLQIAASNSSLGPWNYLGSGCLGGNSDWYDLSLIPGVPLEIGCYPALNNKRYFRYKARLCSSDCIASGLSTPQVDEIIINWSP